MSRLVVRYRAGADDEDIAAVEARHGLVEVRRIPPLRIRAYDDREGLAARLAEEPIVEYVEHEGSAGIR